MSHVLDASVVIAHLDRRDVHHDAATRALTAVAGTALLAHPLTIAECLVAGVRKGAGREVGDAIVAMGIEQFDLDGGSPMRLARLRVETGLRMPDCCVLEVAVESGATLASFDERLLRAARRLGIAVLAP